MIQQSRFGTVTGPPVKGEIVDHRPSHPVMEQCMEGKLDDGREVRVYRAVGFEPIFEIRISRETLRLRLDFTRNIESIMEAFAEAIRKQGV